MMNVDLALRALAGHEFPREAMTWAIENWETASSRLIARLRAYVAGGDRTEAADGQIFYILHLCGQMGETRAYEPLCRLIATDPDLAVSLGDAVAETLPGILIKIFDGDPEPLIQAIETLSADEFARGSALSALGYLVRAKGALDDDAMRGFLRRLWRGRKPDEQLDFWPSWVLTAAALGYEELKIETAVLTKEELLDPMDFNLDDFDRMASLARADPAGLEAFDGANLRPLDDAIATLESWGAEGDDSEFDEDAPFDEDAALDAPYVNPFRDVGRNDPCPCGSGKKYKKCCLAA